MMPNNFIADIREAGEAARDAQGKWKERKDTLTGFIVLLTFVVSTAQAVDWSNMAEYLPVVGGWIIAVIGVAIHRFTEGAVTPKSVERIVEQAEYIGRHRAPGE